MYGLIPFLEREITGLSRVLNESLSESFPLIKTSWGSMDVLEKDNHYVAKIDLPGVKEEDISVIIQDGYMTIQAERKEEKKEEKDSYYYQSRFCGSFSEAFKVGENVSEEDIKADYKDGVLTVTFPKPCHEERKVKVCCHK